MMKNSNNDAFIDFYDVIIKCHSTAKKSYKGDIAFGRVGRKGGLCLTYIDIQSST